MNPPVLPVVPFTQTWGILLLALAVGGVTLWAALRRMPDRSRRGVLCGIAIANWGFSTWFTFDRIAEPAFPDFVFSRNWPLHFCTIATILLVPAMLVRSGPGAAWWVRPLHALLFFPGALAGFLALCAPSAEYIGAPLLSVGALFYLVHGLNVVLPFAHAGLGYYRPRWRDAALSLVLFTVLAVALFLVTLLARAFVDPRANYMYFFDPEGSAILEALWRLIGVPFVYELPLIPLLYPVLLLMVAGHRAVERAAQAIAALRARGLGLAG
ncbi:YwaF family protein [Leucobacter massiliensis]|uniref:TMEM164 family acyltransferase n=1 Tax=Leucobacter massiliensis TaxID=1686285 RepID=UPI0015E4259F|nr:YwaF family protein [Leucobacter massiliensis]